MKPSLPFPLCLRFLQRHDLRVVLLSASCALGLLGMPMHVCAESRTRAASAPESRAQRGEAEALRIFGLLDGDGDGRISLAEAAPAFRFKPSLRDDFAAADTNGDGFLTQAEIRAAADKRRAERQARRARERAAAQAPAAGPSSAPSSE